MNFAAYFSAETSAWVVESLAHVLWQGTLVAGLAAVAALLLRNRSAQARYIVHCTAMLLTAACLPLNLFLLAPAERGEKISVMRGVSVDSAEEVPAPASDETARIVFSDSPVPVDDTPFDGEAVRKIDAPLAITPEATFAWEWASEWIVSAYIVGIAVMAIRLMMGLYGSQRLRLTAHPIEEASLHSVLQRIGERLTLKVLPVVAYSARVATPLVVGVIKPTILLPAAILNDLSTEQVESLLLHELAHIRRYDHWVNLLQRVIEAVLFFHPAVWWLSHQVSIEREHCCDDLAIRWGSEPCDYAESLVRISEVRYRTAGLSGSSATNLAATGGRSSQLRGRVLRVLGMPLPGPSVGLTRVGVGSLLVVVLASAVLLAAFPQGGKFDDPLAEKANADELDGKPVVSSAEKTRDAKSSDFEIDANSPESAGRFQGRVTGPDGKPVADAKVYMVPVRGWNATKELDPVRATTDEKGRFEFEAADMTYTADDGLAARRSSLIIATADGLGPDWMYAWGANQGSITNHLTPRKGAPLDLQLGGPDVPIRGRLLGPDGGPLVNAQVKLTRAMVPWKRDLSSHLVDEEKQVYFMSGPDYARLTYQPELIPGLDSITETDKDGWFVLRGLGRERLARLFVSHPKIVDTHLDVMTREGEDFDASTEFLGGGGVSERTIYASGFTAQLKPGITIRGLVIDEKTSVPIPGMHVGPGLNQNSPLDPELYPHVTDQEGRFEITGLYSTGSRTRNLVAVAGPGLPYRTAWAKLSGDQSHDDVVIRSNRGIPYRLKVIDDRGEPVDARVDYADVAPNPHTAAIEHEEHYPVSKATRVGPGVYEGFVLPGPGVIRVEGTHKRYRPAMVDPQSFFGDGRSEINPDKYGTTEMIKTVNRRHISGDHWYRQYSQFQQRDYDALVLVNPAPGSKALELTARVISDVPRDVTLVDSDSKPVVGATMMRGSRYRRSTLRSSSFTLSRLHPDRVERVGFLVEDRELVGYLPAKNDANDLYTVRMQQWATVTGRLVDEEGKPLANQRVAAHSDAIVHYSGNKCDQDGRFVIKKLAPGYPVRSTIWLRHDLPTQKVFEDVVLQPGEVRDLGDIQLRSWADIENEVNGAATDEQSSSSNSKTSQVQPAEENGAWGEAIDGLQARLIPKKLVWPEGKPPTFDIEVQSLPNGDESFKSKAATIPLPHYTLPRSTHQLNVEVDGKWNTWRNGVVAGYTGYPHPTKREKSRVLKNFKSLTLDDNWGREWESPGGAVVNQKDFIAKEPLNLSPGKHTVRVKVLGELVTQSVEITVVAESSAPPSNFNEETKTVAEEKKSKSEVAPLIRRPGIADIDSSRTRPVTVRVLNLDGKPVDGTSFRIVWWRDDEGDYDYSTAEPTQSTDQDGKVTLAVPYGAERASFRAEAPNFASIGDELSLSGEPIVRLQPGRIIKVLAVGLDGEPVKEAVPMLENSRTWPREFKADTQQTGLFVSPVVSVERRWLRVVGSGKDGKLLFSELIDITNPTKVNKNGEIVIQLSPGIRLTGRLDDSVPRPIRNGCVELYIQESEGHRLVSGKGWSWQDTAAVKEDGTFEFPSLPSGGHVQLFALVDGYHSSLPAASELREYLAMHKLGDAALVEPAIQRDYWPRLFSLDSDEALVEVELPCTPTGAVDVRVVDPLGNPIEGAIVKFNPNCFFLGGEAALPGAEGFLDSKRLSGQFMGVVGDTSLKNDPLELVRDWAMASFYQVRTDADGIARVRNLPAGKRMTCRTEAEGYVMPSEPKSSRDFDARYALIEPQRGKTLRRTITMERFVATSPRDLSVVDQSGKPVAGITVTGGEIAFTGSEEDWQYWSVQRFGPTPTSKTDDGGQLRFDVPTEVNGQRVAAIRFIVEGRINGDGRDAYVQRRRVAIPPEDDSKVIVLTVSGEEPTRPNAFREVKVTYASLSQLKQATPQQLLSELEQNPSLTVLKRLLTASGFEKATPLSFRPERNMLGRFNDKPSPVARVQLDKENRIVVMCRVRPAGASWKVKPKLRFPPEAAFVFDATSGQLVTMLGGWASSRGSYCNATLTDLGTPGDYFVSTSAFEDNGPFEYIKKWTRLGEEEQPALTIYGYANSMSWSSDSQEGTLAAEYGHTGYEFNGRDIDDKLPGSLTSSVLAPRKVYWDGRLKTFVGPAEMSYEGTPLFRVETEESAAFQALSLKSGELLVAGGRRSYKNWHLWNVMIPKDRAAKLELTLQQETADGITELESRTWSLSSGLQKVQLQIKPSQGDNEPDVEVRIGDERAKVRYNVPSIAFEKQRSAPEESAVRTTTTSVTLARYKTSEPNIWLVGQLTAE